MKKAILTLAMVLAATSAHAKKTPKPYIIDMTGKHFHDDQFNQFADGIDMTDLDGFAMKVEGEYEQDFTVEARGSEPTVQCKATLLKKSAKQSILILDSSVETDSGETCDYTITYRDGRHATLSVSEEGT